ncbi:MAG: FUSC family protein, partial [Verrucomicrobia bacterium]|nr:FUSC family protein [Verrucomicrobiota bacterium]
SLEPARKIWGAIRARRSGPTARSRQLLLLIEQLDDLGRTLVTLREIVNLVAKEPWFDEFRGGFQELTSSLVRLVREVAEAVSVRGKQVDSTPVRQLLQRLENSLAQKTDEGATATLQQKELRRVTRHLVEQLVMLAEIASELRSGRRMFPEPPEAKFGPRPSTFNPIAEIRNSLSFRSTSFRHALRLGVATTLAALLASTFHLARGYWIPLTVVLVLKPNFGGTLQRCVQRISGTVLGGLIGALLLMVFREPWLLVASLTLLAFATFTLRNRNYGLFALALTPLVMIMLDVTHPGTVTDSFLRILHTVIGSALALLNGYLLLPVWESRRFPVHVAGAFRAEAAFLRAFGKLLQGRVDRPMAEFRRAAAIAVSNAATAAERLLTEPPQRRGDVEATLSAANACREILHALAAISDYPTRESLPPQSGYLAKLVDAVAAGLDDLATSLDTGSNPGPLTGVSSVNKWLEETMPALPSGGKTLPVLTVKDSKAVETGAWLFYHLNHVAELTLTAREVVSRLIQSEQPKPKKS